VRSLQQLVHRIKCSPVQKDVEEVLWQKLLFRCHQVGDPGT